MSGEQLYVLPGAASDITPPFSFSFSHHHIGLAHTEIVVKNDETWMALAFAWLSVRRVEDCVLLSEYRGRESRVCCACSRLDRTSRYRLRAGRLAR